MSVDLHPSDGLQASGILQTDTNLIKRKALFEPIPVITGRKEGVELSTDEVAPSLLPEGKSTVPEQPNPQPNDQVPNHSGAHLPGVICFVLKVVMVCCVTLMLLLHRLLRMVPCNHPSSWSVTLEKVRWCFLPRPCPFKMKPVFSHMLLVMMVELNLVR